MSDFRCFPFTVNLFEVNYRYRADLLLPGNINFKSDNLDLKIPLF